ncbi:MAG: ribonuclease P protein subunit [Crenarchaeota archaeon]|nr:MAG: ribonuclease P protein subunit [Thermoproteota archaeon]RDJ34113.1 MAG: ribonuclease P protein subunit [Thermoproteota archaeon]RDJ36771.1 MAG: ribonuclease P protein subunit [Thermoproteota archaeon]RDJ37695.1 MAG: ribonuclease P protein subunit [Thermoproteota archaeon]
MSRQELLAVSEMIGLHAKIVESTNEEIITKNGIIIDETKSMFTLKTETGEKKFPKENSKWEFDFKNEKIILDGNQIAKKPQDRWRIKI